MPYKDAEERRRYQRERRLRLKGEPGMSEKSVCEAPEIRLYFSWDPDFHLPKYGVGGAALDLQQRSHPAIRFKHGHFVTADPAKQKLIEMDSEYGKTVFRLSTA